MSDKENKKGKDDPPEAMTSAYPSCASEMRRFVHNISLTCKQKAPSKDKTPENKFTEDVRKLGFPVSVELSQHHIEQIWNEDQIRGWRGEEEVRAGGMMTISCPYCGKIFATLDEGGCVVESLGVCADVICEGGDDSFCYYHGFDIFEQILGLLQDVEHSDYTCRLINQIAGVRLTVESMECLSSLIEVFDEDMDTICHEWYGDAAECYSYYFFVVERRSQAAFLEKLKAVKDKLEDFVLASVSEPFVDWEKQVKERRSIH